MSFDWSTLLPLQIAATVTVLPAVLNAFGRKRSAALAEVGYYGFSTGMRAFIWFGVFFFTIFPFLANTKFFRCHTGKCTPPGNFLDHKLLLAGMLFMVIVLFVGAIWTDRYAVSMMRDSFEFGAFNKTKIWYGDVESIKVVTTSRGTPYLCINTRNRGKLKIEGSVQNFDDLVKKLTAKIDAAKALQQTAQASTWS